MKESIQETAGELIPETNRKEHKSWMTEDILNLMEERRKAKNDDNLYNRINKTIRNNCNEAKEQWINSCPVTPNTCIRKSKK